MVVDLLMEAIAEAAAKVCLATGRAVLIVASLGRIRTGPFWGGREAWPMSLYRSPSGHLVVGDVWSALCGAAVWAAVILLGWLMS